MSQNADTIRQWIDAFNAFMRGKLSIEAWAEGCDPQIELLGVPALFALDEQELEKRHRDLSRALHPDRYAGRPSSERREALSRAIVSQ